MKRYKDTEYFVSKDGEVYRFGKKKKLIKEKNGYLRIGLWVNGKRYSKKVHRLVAETYIPNPDNKPQVNHINGVKTDNRIENLEWVTRSENQLHSTRVLGNKIGEKCYNSKLTENDVKYIKENHVPRHKEFGGAALGRKFNVHITTISKIITHKNWTHI